MNYGTRTLLTCIAIIVAFQVLIALPFVLNDSTVEDYLVRSKLTGAGRNGIAHSEEFWDYLAARKTLTIFWDFVPGDFYYARDGLAKYCKIGIVSMNVWHFFIKQGALMPCINNLIDFLKCKPDKNEISNVK